MTSSHILVVDDELDILELLHYNLSKLGYDVTCANSGEDALTKLTLCQPNLVLLDLMLPGIDGLEVCKAIKRNAQMANIPIIMLSARGEEADVVTGLELGADDYLTKPFSPRVLIARIKVVLRRQHLETQVDEAIIQRGDLLLNPGRHSLSISNRPVSLTSMEFRILHLLVRRPGWVFTRHQILEAVSGHDTSVTDRSVDVHMVSLRRKLGLHGDVIETIRGVGYRFQDEL
jgi:two-component system, OmpR family, alkaline phosphatase synthesis response regulator PhoP